MEWWWMNYNWLDSLEKLKINCFKSKKLKSRQIYKAESWIWLEIKDIRGLRRQEFKENRKILWHSLRNSQVLKSLLPIYPCKHSSQIILNWIFKTKHKWNQENLPKRDIWQSIYWMLRLLTPLTLPGSKNIGNFEHTPTSHPLYPMLEIEKFAI